MVLSSTVNYRYTVLCKQGNYTATSYQPCNLMIIFLYNLAQRFLYSLVPFPNFD